MGEGDREAGLMAKPQKGNLLTHRLSLSIPEAASVLGVCPNTVSAEIKRGRIPTIRHGRRVLIPVAALRRRLDELADGVDGPAVVTIPPADEQLR